MMRDLTLRNPLRGLAALLLLRKSGACRFGFGERGRLTEVKTAAGRPPTLA